jgi:hypothetical protein
MGVDVCVCVRGIVRVCLCIDIDVVGGGGAGFLVSFEEYGVIGDWNWLNGIPTRPSSSSSLSEEHHWV